MESPLFNEKDRFEPLTDAAICKIAGVPDGGAHQPLHVFGCLCSGRGGLRAN